MGKSLMSNVPHSASETPAEVPEVHGTESFWQTTKGAVVLAVISAILIFAVSVTADLLIIRYFRAPIAYTVEISDAISSVIIGLLFFRLFRFEQLRRGYLRKRVEIIADMNHHVRNALQVISFTAQAGNSKQEIGAIRDSVNRIQWALKELLPKI